MEIYDGEEDEDTVAGVWPENHGHGAPGCHQAGGNHTRHNKSDSRGALSDSTWHDTKHGADPSLVSYFSNEGAETPSRDQTKTWADEPNADKEKAKAGDDHADDFVYAKLVWQNGEGLECYGMFWKIIAPL